MLSNLAYKKSEGIADKIISDLKISKPPIPIEDIVKSLGLTITEYEFEKRISAVLVISEGKGTIGLNPHDSEYRKRFSLAHELGHYLMHKDTSEVFIDKDFLVKWRNAESNSNYSVEETNQELEANAFAAAILMPKDLIEKEMAKKEFANLNENQLLEQLATKFNVSLPAMAFRVTNINSYYL